MVSVLKAALTCVFSNNGHRNGKIAEHFSQVCIAEHHKSLMSVLKSVLLSHGFIGA